MSLAASSLGFRLEAQAKIAPQQLAKGSHVASGVLSGLRLAAQAKTRLTAVCQRSHVASGVLLRIPASGAGQHCPRAVGQRKSCR